ncbi:MAG: TetR/AcrR family transcriptional regulator [Candidatus Neomarinimicrobiota bacterium]
MTAKKNNKEYLRKKQILDAALNVVVQKGYSNSRMDDIVEESKLSKGAIYWYYKSKKEVFLSLVNHWVNNFGVTLNHIVREDLSATAQLKELFNFFLHVYTKNQKVFKAELEFWSLASRDKDFHDKTQKVYHEFLALLEGIVGRGVESGEFKKIDTKVAALSIMVNIEGIIWFTLFDVEELSAKHYFETITEFILAGLTKRSGEKK